MPKYGTTSALPSCFLPEPSKEVGDVFKCIADGFCIESAHGKGETIGKSIRSVLG